jgi:hypothetical protein
VPELFLDGTAQFHSIEELPSMDRGAKVLVVTDERGVLQQIPWNQPGEFSHSEETTIQLRPDLSAELQIRANSRGAYAASIRRTFEIVAQRKTDLEKVYGQRFAGASVRDQSFSELAQPDEPVTFAVTVVAPRFLQEAPEGLAVPAPEDFFQTGKALANVGSLETRNHDVVLGSPRRSTLRTIYVLPEGFQVKSLPPDVDLKTRFGRLQVTQRKEEDSRRIVVERVLELSVPRIALADYAAFREFAARVNRIEDEVVLLERS